MRRKRLPAPVMVPVVMAAVMAIAMFFPVLPMSPVFTAPARMLVPVTFAHPLLFYKVHRLASPWGHAIHGTRTTLARRRRRWAFRASRLLPCGQHLPLRISNEIDRWPTYSLNSLILDAQPSFRAATSCFIDKFHESIEFYAIGIPLDGLRNSINVFSVAIFSSPNICVLFTFCRGLGYRCRIVIHPRFSCQ